MAKQNMAKRLEPSAKVTGKANSTFPENGFGSASFPFQMGQLEVRQLPWPVLQQTGAGNRQRDGNQIFCRGIKINRLFQYRAYGGSTSDVGPVIVNWALLQCKNYMSITTIIEKINEDFLRDLSLDGRSRDFEPYAQAGDPWRQSMNVCPINPDNNFNVLSHKRKMIQIKANADNIKANSIWWIKKYFKIGKRFTFPANEENQPINTIFECFWYNSFSVEQFPVTPAGPGAASFLSTNYYNQVYFNDID